MKLYGTIKSERASKGQGGNDYLEIDIQNVKQDVMAKIRIEPTDDTKAKMTLSYEKDYIEIKTTDCETVLRNSESHSGVNYG